MGEEEKDREKEEGGEMPWSSLTTLPETLGFIEYTAPHLIESYMVIWELIHLLNTYIYIYYILSSTIYILHQNINVGMLFDYYLFVLLIILFIISAHRQNMYRIDIKEHKYNILRTKFMI